MSDRNGYRGILPVFKAIEYTEHQDQRSCTHDNGRHTDPAMILIALVDFFCFEISPGEEN